MQESVNDHTTTKVRDDELQESAAMIRAVRKRARAARRWQRQYGWWAKKRARGTKRVMALAMRVVCHKKGNGAGGTSDGNKGGRQVTASRMMATVMATATS